MTIITHPGQAHSDELTAIALFLAVTGIQADAVAVVRREPTITEMLDSGTVCIDVGYKACAEWAMTRIGPDKEVAGARASYANEVATSGELLNFEHHGDRSLPAAFRLVAKHFGLDDMMRDAFASWDYQSDVDTTGPYAANAKHGISGDTAQTVDLMMSAMLADFGSYALVPVEVVEQIARYGRLMLARAESFAETLAAHVDAVVLKACPGGPVMFGDIVGDARALHVMKARLEANAGVTIGLSITRSSRMEDGAHPWGLHRYNDDARYDFRRLRNEDKVVMHPMVTFVHDGGFYATVNGNRSWETLREVVAMGVVPGSVGKHETQRTYQLLHDESGDNYQAGFEAQCEQDEPSSVAWHGLAIFQATQAEEHAAALRALIA